ncbi:hypothetical protein DUNSADRAFT_8735 [Dunaliella salina]|uniref:Peptidase S54 rhomboid domain-containing protein n=1 Tax=Dunaliella salina TaxID=3046 RepID=A0ABQ7GIX9_DUNSA|nr:hypothetical protein DUNSADRAFT_8735 [Dunaliella salina]|eukprot:KAF5834568.1 hypothetical protein DUNSADRAFT_8735 [Dunaliella salina]
MHLVGQANGLGTVPATQPLAHLANGAHMRYLHALPLTLHTSAFAQVNVLILGGQWWRLLTANFLHSSFLHLAINCHALSIIGPHVEMIAGSKRTAVVYVAAGITGSLASFVMTPAPSVGASGALFGLGAALALFYWRHKHLLKGYSDKVLRSLGITLAINLGYSLLVRNIDNWGHVGGMLGGAAVSVILGPRYVRGESPSGSWIADRPPLKILAFPERQVSVRQEMTEKEKKHLESKKYGNKDDSNRADGEEGEGEGRQRGRKRSRKGGEVEAAEDRT